MIVDKYEQEAKLIAERLYRKKWSKVSGNLKQEIYQMAVDVVRQREKVEMDSFSLGIKRILENDSFDSDR